jgi:hypothetical protein
MSSERDALENIKRTNPALYRRLIAPSGGLRGDNERAVLNAYQEKLAEERSPSSLAAVAAEILKTARVPVDVKKVQKFTGKRVDFPSGFVLDGTKTRQILDQHGLSDVDTSTFINGITEAAAQGPKQETPEQRRAKKVDEVRSYLVKAGFNPDTLEYTEAAADQEAHELDQALNAVDDTEEV